MPESLIPAAAGSASAAELPALSLNSSGASRALGVHAFPVEIEWRRAFWLCLAAAMVCVVVMSLRLVGPLLAVLGAGCLAVVLCYRRNPIAISNPRVGARIGALTGLLSSAVPSFFFVIFLTMMQSGGEARDAMIESLQQFAARSTDPQVQATFDLLKTPEGLSKLKMAMVGFLLLSVAAGSLAGALTSLVLKRRKPS